MRRLLYCAKNGATRFRKWTNTAAELTYSLRTYIKRFLYYEPKHGKTVFRGQLFYNVVISRNRDSRPRDNRAFGVYRTSPRRVNSTERTPGKKNWKNKRKVTNTASIIAYSKRTNTLVTFALIKNPRARTVYRRAHVHYLLILYY